MFVNLKNKKLFALAAANRRVPGVGRADQVPLPGFSLPGFSFFLFFFVLASERHRKVSLRLKKTNRNEALTKIFFFFLEGVGN